MPPTRWRAPLLLAIVLVGGAALRLYGLNWDGGHWLHPDERQIYFLALGLGWPASVGQALRPDSPLNPGFFAYGSLPIYFLRGMAELLAPVWPTVRDADNLHLVGRPLAVMLDLGTVALTYRLGSRRPGSREPGKWGGGLLAAALVAVAVAHVQAAHFYIADVMLTFWAMLALNLAFDVAGGAGRPARIALGLTIGLALATKASAAPLLLLPIAAYLIRRRPTASPNPESTSLSRSNFHRVRHPLRAGPRAWEPALLTKLDLPSLQISSLLVPIGLTFLLAAATFVLVQPYTLIDGHTFLADTVREAQIASGRLDVPYTQQYAGTVPYLYPMWQTALWGLGLPVGLAAWAGFGALAARWLRRGQSADTLLIAWAGPYLLLTGWLHAKPLRYMLPLAPVLCLLAAEGVWRWGRLGRKSWAGKWILGIGYSVLGVATIGYAVAFVSMYGQAHPWVEASEWIYRQVEPGSVVAVEDWDTPLPLPLAVDGQARRIEDFDLRVLRLYDEPDDAAKWQAIAADLAQSDLVVVASRRLYGSLPRLPERYPATAGYHRLLFEGELGFVLAGEFTRGPEWLNPRVPPLPGSMPGVLVPDESLVVYDHPRALVFENVARLPANVLWERVREAVE